MIADSNKEMHSKIPIKFLDEDPPALAEFDPEVVVDEEQSHAENGDAALTLTAADDTVDESIVETIDMDETPSLCEYEVEDEIAAAPVVDEPAPSAASGVVAAAAATTTTTATAVTAAAVVMPPAAEVDAPAPKADEPVVESDSDIESRTVAARLEKAEIELAAADEDRQALAERVTRVQADYENFRKRTEREKARTYQGLVGDVARDLLPVLDNLQRCLEAEASVKGSESEKFRHFLNGVEMIYRQLEDTMKKLGLRPVETIGLRFDPHVHEAVATEFSDRHEPDTVLEEMVRGYHIGESLLRPAMVKVSSR